MTAGFKATEGNGGAPVVVSREPVVGPVYDRGDFRVSCIGHLHDEARIDFALNKAGYRITYHDVSVISSDGVWATVFVGPHDVVTWERIGE